MPGQVDAAAMTECFLTMPASRLLLMNDGHAVFDWLKVPRVAKLPSLYNLTHTHAVHCRIGLITLEKITSYPIKS